MDKQGLQNLIDNAIEARDALDKALRSIEIFVGKGDLDGLDEIMDTCGDADSLIEWLIEQGYEEKAK